MASGDKSIISQHQSERSMQEEEDEDDNEKERLGDLIYT